jgi:eukaryotic-like serine/threonine-protein kinase
VARTHTREAPSPYASTATGSNVRRSLPRRAPDSEPPPKPELPARFALRDPLGRGGMGTVYRVHDTELGVDIALKSLHELGWESRTWLKAEFRSLVDLVHPNLVQLHELFIDDERCFFTMELVRGMDLLGHIERQDPQALRECGRQLALALAAVHRAGKLHRDVKPSNVLVTDSGRVVLLDFGLVEPISAPFENHPSGRIIAGTVQYMSPEQAWGERLSAASDWYSFGATFFEALTGQLPESSLVRDSSTSERKSKERHPSRFKDGIAQDLDELVGRLLSRDPEQRPSEAEILSTLGGTSVKGVVSLPPSPLERQSAPFVGRELELGRLRRAFARAAAGESVVVYLSGASGIGKSELMRRFVEELGSSALVLRGRCHPQEAVPFNALDGAIDDLTDKLADLDRERFEALAPPGLDALLRLFPGLARAPALARVEPAAKDEPPQEVRRRAFSALCELLGRAKPIGVPLLWLDDVQWGDVDSGTLARELLSGPARPPLLAVLTFREEDRDNSATLNALSPERGRFVPDEEIQLEPLSVEDGAALIRSLLASVPVGREAKVESLSREAAGSPFLLCEAARYIKAFEHEAGEIKVQDMLHRRTSDLADDARRVLELVSVAGEPIDQRVLLQAAGLQAAQQPLFRTLEQLSIVRTAAGAPRLAEVYHHRVRDHVLGALSAERRRAYHRSLADALLSVPAPSLQSVIEHYERGGDDLAAKRYVVPAARQAADAFAFARAAALYRRAIELGATELEPAELHVELGRALSSAGRGREAGEAFDQATALLENGPERDEAQILLLRRRAAETFLQSGHDQQAIAALEVVLNAHGVELPKTRGQALRWALALRFKSLFRDLEVEARSAAETPQPLLDRFDALWAVSMRLTMLNHTRTSYFAARCLVDALSAREPSRLVLGLSLEAPNLTMVPSAFFQKRADRMLTLAAELAEGTGKPYDRAIVLAGRAATQWLRGGWRASLDLMDAASELIRRSAQGVSWEHALFDVWAMASLAQLGRYKELARRGHRALREAAERDDRYLGRNCCLGEPSLAWLAEDRADWALEMADRAIAWSPDEYTTQHYHHYLTSAQALLYKGDAAAAHERSVHEWPLLKENFFLGAPCIRDELVQLRARTALAAAAESGTQQRRKLLGLVRSSVKELRSHGLECGRGWAFLLEAGAANLERQSSALELTRRAQESFRKVEMRGYEEAARFAEGLLSPGSRGEQLRTQAASWFEAEGVVQPQRFIAMLAPALGDDFSTPSARA